MNWLTEDPWPVIILAAFAELIFLVQLARTRRAVYLAVMGGLAILAAGLVLAERLVVTEREEVEAALDRLVAEVQKDELEPVLELVSPSSPHIAALAARGLELVDVETVRIDELQILVPGTATPRLGTAHFRARVIYTVRDLPPRPETTRWDLTFRKEQESWLLYDLQRREPFGQQRPIPVLAEPR